MATPTAQPNGGSALDITDEDRQRMRFRKALARKKRRDREAEGEIKELNITAMMDLMTIILVFLIKLFSASSITVTASEDVRPPMSTARATLEQAQNMLVSNSDNLDLMIDNFRQISDNFRQFSDTVKQQPSSLVWKDTKPDRQPPGEKTKKPKKRGKDGKN